MKKFALISAILFFVVYFWANTFVSDDDTQTVVYPAVAANPSAERPAADEAVLNRIMEAESPADEDIVPNPVLESDTPVDEDGGYFLIVGSFSNLDQARQLALKYEDDFDADIIVLPPTSQGLYRVSYGRYTTSEEAGASLPAVRGKVSSDAWIYKLK